jgi:hypothetical protein
LKQPTAVLVAFFSAGVALAAARIYTNPNPTDHLKKLFPSAAAFSPLAGEPLHLDGSSEVTVSRPRPRD